MPMDQPITYATPQPNSRRWCNHFGIFSFALCALEFPWLFCVGQAWWSGFIEDRLLDCLAPLPAAAALVLGAIAVMRSRRILDRVLGAVGTTSASAWLCFMWRYR